MKRLLPCITLLITLLASIGYAQASVSSQELSSIGSAIAALPGADPAIRPMFSGCYRIDVVAINDAYEQRVVELVNQYRAQNNLPPLKRIANLDFAARYHAADMAADDYFNHDTYDGHGGTTLVCDTWTRFDQFVSNAGWRGENIAGGYSTPAAVMDGWMNSTGHRENILRPEFSEIGVGYYTGGSWGNYWVQDFDNRPGTYYPLVINGEAATTTSPQVSLYIYGKGTWDEMRLRNDSGAWTAWQTFQDRLSWSLPCTSGAHTVSVEMRLSGQTSAATSASDSINLQNSAGGAAALGNLPASVTFLYDQSRQQFDMPSYTFRPTNSASSQTLNWTVTKSGFESDWLNLSATNGATPNNSFTATPSGAASILSALGDHSGNLTITAASTDAQCPASASATIPIHVFVASALQRMLIPIILR